MNEEEHKIEQHIADWSTKDKEKFQKLVDQCGIPLIIQAFHYLEQEENEITYKSVKSALRELEEAAETDVTELPDQNTQTNEVETTLDTADSDEVQGVDDLKGEISETVYPQKDRRYYSEYVEKLLDNQEIEGFALRDYQKRITLDMSDFVDAPSKAAALTLLVGGGKSKMTPVFGLLANAKGKRFVACCYNNTLLLELLKGIRETFGEIYVNGENLLVIPSLENAYRVFFNVAVSKDGETDSETDATKGLAEYLYPKTKEDEEQIAQWIVRCKTYADEETRKKMAEKLSIRDLKKGSQKKGKKEWKKHICSEYERKLYLLSKQADKADKAFRSLLDVLKKVEKYENEKEWDLLQKYRDLFRQYEADICGWIQDISRLFWDNDNTEIIKNLPWVKKLYPGILFEQAAFVLMTFAKTDQAICKVGAYAGVSLTDTGNGLPSNNVIFIDESDRYCSSLLSGCIDNAVSCPIDIFPFVQLFFEKLRLFHDKYTGFENQFQKQKSMWSSFFNVYGNPVSDRKFEEYLSLDKGNGEMLDKCLQILERCVTKIKKYKERYQIEFGDVTKYCSEEENGIPTLNVDTWNQVEVLTGVRNDEQLFICKNDEDSTLYIQPIAKSAKEEDTARRFTDFIRDTVLCIGDILALCRTFVNTYEKLNSGSTLYQALRSVLGRIAGIELAKEYYEFVSHNLYGYKNQTVRENSFYARGFMIIKLVRNAVSSQRTQIKAYKVSQLPDYKLANMIYSHDKVIFSSGTAELHSISNADMSYIEKSVMDKMRYDVGCLDEETGEPIKKRAFVSVERIQKSRDILMRMQSEDAPFWYSLKESSAYAEKQLKEMQRKKLEGKQIHICTYDREAHAKDNKKDCFYDMQRLAEATGKNIEELRYYLTYNQKDGSVANAKSFGRVAFAMWALEQMIRNGVQTGLIYQNALPLLEWNLSGDSRGAADNQNVYTMKILKDLAVCVAQKYGIVPEKIRIERCDTKTLKTHIEALSEGLYPDEIYLLLSAYDSLGAGTDLYYRKRNANGEVVKIKAGDSMEDRYDLDAIFLDEVTNVIKSSHDNEEKSIVRTQLSAEYEVSKIAKIEAARGEFTAESGMKRLPFIMKQIQAGKGFDKCLYKEDPQSPYHHEIMAKVLQAYGRIDRGKQKHSSVIVAASDTLLNSAGIGSQSYQNVPTCYMFDLLLQKADQMHNKQQKPDSLSQYEREYQENNEKYNAWIWEIMKRISSFKKDKNLIKLRSTIRVYEIARKNIFTMGYGKENVSGFYDIPDKNGKPDDYWGVSLGRIEHPEKGYSWQADLKRMNGAFLTNGKTYVDIRSGKEHLKALDAYVERGYLGEGWEAEFATILENRDAILRNGFKYPPFAETYYIFLGIFYEKLLLCMFKKGGILDIGRELVELPMEQYEDADYRIAGTDVFIDVKSYARTRAVVKDKQKLLEKGSRCSRKSAFVYINVKPHEDIIPFDRYNQSFGDNLEICLINGILSFSESPEMEREKIYQKREKLLALCERYAIREEER